jgi:hypothetical protein
VNANPLHDDGVTNKMNTISTSDTSKGFGFWDSLPLSRKLLLAFGALFAFGLVIAASGLFGLNRVQGAYEDSLAGGVRIQNLSDHLNSELLEARRREKDFLLRWQEEGFDWPMTTMCYQPTTHCRNRQHYNN